MARRASEDVIEIPKDLPTHVLQQCAEEHILEVWRTIAYEKRKGHPFHPELNTYRSEALTTISDRIRRTPISVNLPRHPPIDPCPDVLAPRLTDEAIRKVLDTAHAYYSSVASDPRILVWRRAAPDNAQSLTIQHVASTIRIRIYVPTNAAPVISAKAQALPLLAPTPTGVSDEEFRGLGIGTVLYRRAAAELPDARFPKSMVSEYSAAIRRKLHAEDPWVWAADGCRWCFDSGVIWMDATRGELAAHPRSSPPAI